LAVIIFENVIDFLKTKLPAPVAGQVEAVLAGDLSGIAGQAGEMLKGRLGGASGEQK
jgi:hypothetical protein